MKIPIKEFVEFTKATVKLIEQIKEDLIKEYNQQGLSKEEEKMVKNEKKTKG